MTKMEADFLESKLPAKAFATLTTPGQMAQCRLDESFRVWIRDIQAHNRLTLGWIKSIENDPHRHIHAVLIAAGPLDCAHAATLWQMMVAPRYSEAARVEPYREGVGGLEYVLKGHGSLREEIQLSEHIRAFAPGCEKSLFSTNSAQRRQVRRIKAEILRAAR